MEKTFEPKSFERRLYAKWESSGYFRAEIDKNRKPFTIVMPPPNITGQLHMGHSLDNTIQDCLIRFKRMQGYSTLWLPGTDHASIATELKIVEMLKKEGKDKLEVGRERFLELAWNWKKQYSGRIVEQLRYMGSSCDWSREAFTMDENLSRAVRHVFVKLYNDGLIYKGDRIINMCTSCGTAISDAEVEYVTKPSHLWHFKYKLSDDSGWVEFATTRPETMLGDTAIAVNPDDERYTAIIGKTVIVPFDGREIPVVADSYVEKDFGTGVVKITPAHDPNDFEVGLRHNLEIRKIMDEHAVINELGGEFKGMDRYECRTAITEKMRQLGQLVSIEDYEHNVGECYRCHTVVEPIVSKQWFVKMKPLAEPAIRAVKEGEVSYVPSYFEKSYLHWMENIKDWCISRQLWWGHRIPVYYCNDCGEVICSEDAPTECPHCNGHSIRQDEDVLDTWFSSALWPFSTLGFPERTADLEYFYPTDVLVTGYDIIPFWVSRMIFSAYYNMNERPFKDVLVHGLIRDEKGRKMSKSLGNGVDPLDLIEKYGADTLRISLLFGVSNGTDIRFSEEKASVYRNFLNKIWNAARFVLQNIEGKALKPLNECKLSDDAKWLLSKLNTLTKEVTAHYESYDLGMAAGKLYDFVWSCFCDWYIEFTKPVLYGTDEDARIDCLSVLVYAFDKILKLLHPITPFITEEIYLSMPNHGETIMLERFPLYDEALDFPKEEALMENVKDLIAKVRTTRAEMNVTPSKRIRLIIKLNKGMESVEAAKIYIQKLANGEVEFTPTPQTEKTVALVCAAGEVYIPLGDMVDTDKEIARLNKELETVESEIQRANGKLNNQGFLAKAPEKLVEEERSKLNGYIDMKEKLIARIAELKSNQQDA